MSRPRPVVLAGTVVLVALVAWVVLSIATGLIFHLMPAAPVVGAILGYRWADGDVRLPWSTTAALAAIGVAAAIVGSVLVRSFGGLLDDPVLLLGAIAVGLVLALFLARRPTQTLRGTASLTRHLNHQTDQREERP
ncbi:MAG: hypothetical protein ABI573_04230 [Chloroflexota bacterium]